MSLLTLPTSPPAPASVIWNIDNFVGVSRSPYGPQSQVYDWLQGKLEASITMPLLTPAQIGPWVAFMMSCRGPVNTFLFGDYAYTPAASASGTVSAANQVGFSLVTSLSGVSVGDWIQVAGSPQRLYRVTSVSGGTLGIWPNLRESPASGAAVTNVNPKGTFRMKTSGFKWSQGILQNTIDFEIEEAI